MRKHSVLGVLIIVIALWGAAPVFKAHAAGDAHYFRFVGVQQQELVFQPMTPPLFGVQQISGPKIEEHALLRCKWNNEDLKTEHGDPYPALIGDCENGVKLRVTGIDLNH